MGAAVGDLEVRGGRAGVTAGLADLRRAADHLDRVGDLLRTGGLAGIRLATDPGLLASVVWSPRTGLRAIATLGLVGGAPGGLLAIALRVEVTARSVRAAAAAYEAVDAAVDRALDEVQGELVRGVGLAIGSVAPEVLLGGGALVLGDRLHDALPDPAQDALEGLLLRSGVSAAADDLAQDADDLWRASLFEAPWITDVVAGSAPELMQGLVEGAGPWAVWGVRSAASATGAPWPPTSYEDAVAVVIAGGALFGAFDDHAPREVGRVDPMPGSHPPRDLADLFSQDAGLTDHRAHSRVRIVQVPQPDGSSAWIAQIPGTQEWSPHAGTNPFDLTGDLHLMGGDTTTAMRSVRRALESAMAEAGVPAGQPVLLSGHSQGGIVAAALAASPSFRRRFHVTRVVTSGAPIARFAIPPSVRVLSLEHEQDIVPRLEGQANPDRATWVTVHRDVSGEVHDPIAAHDRTLYAETARDTEASTDPSLVAWRRGEERFFHAGGRIREYAVGRVTGQPSPAGPTSGSASCSVPPAPGTPAPTDSSSSSDSASRSVAAPLN